MLASIPSPHTGVVHLGPLTLHMYGLTLLVAILACVWLTGNSAEIRPLRHDRCCPVLFEGPGKDWNKDHIGSAVRG